MLVDDVRCGGSDSSLTVVCGSCIMLLMSDRVGKEWGFFMTVFCIRCV